MSRDFKIENLIRCAKILDLPRNLSFSEDDVRNRWRKTIERVHPDAGGNNFLAEEANNAKDTLIEWIKANRPYDIDEQQRQSPPNTGASSSQTPNVERIATAVVTAFGGLSKFVKGTLTAVFWFAVIGIGIQVFKKATGPSCELSNVRSEENVFTVNGQPDYGYTTHVDVKNAGIDGFVKVIITIKTSEGNFNREWRGKMTKDEQRTIKADFEEPTVNAKFFNALASCTDER